MSIFSPYADSFVLIQGPIVRPSFPVFSPYADSFVLIQGPIVRPSFPVFSPYADSFVLTRGSNVADVTPQSVESTGAEQSKINDQSKRNFLKVAGVAGASIIASQILSPKKASALIMGSSPTTGVVGVKNAANVRINPATEETVSSLLKPADLSFESGSLKVKVIGDDSSSFSNSGNVDKRGLVDVDRHVQVDVLSSALPSLAATEATLQTISTENTLETISFGGTKYTLRLETVDNYDYIGEAPPGSSVASEVWRLKRIDNSSDIVIQWAGGGGFNKRWNDRVSPPGGYS